MGDIRAVRPLLQPDIDQKKTSLDAVELSEEILQDVRHGGRRRVCRGRRAVAVLLPSQSRATMADDSFVVARNSTTVRRSAPITDLSRGEGRKATPKLPLASVGSVDAKFV